MFFASIARRFVTRLFVAPSSPATTAVIASAVVMVLVPIAAAQRVSQNLIVFYEFQEASGDTVGDTSGFGEPLDLTIDDPSAVSWETGHLTVEAPTIISSADPATKVIDAVQLTEEITVEAWVHPFSNTLFGAARMVGVSNPDPAQASVTRNFMLGQDNANIDFRFRTTTTGDNGTNPELHTDSTGDAVADPPELMHIVGTRAADGTALIYVDGEIRSDVNDIQGGDPSNWDPTYRFALAHEFADPAADSRSWLGDYHLVAVYNRALSDSEVGLNFDAGPDAENEPLLLGDFNSDGRIDINDFSILAGNFKVGQSFAEGDINFDRRVDLTDFVAFRAIFTAAGAANAMSVPEPVTGMQSIVGWSLLLLRWRSRGRDLRTTGPRKRLL